MGVYQTKMVDPPGSRPPGPKDYPIIVYVRTLIL